MLYLFCLAGSIGGLTAGLAISAGSDYNSGGGGDWIIDLEVKGEDFKFAGDENGKFEQRLNVRLNG